MGPHRTRVDSWVLAAACWLVLPSVATAQELVLVACGGPGRCAYQGVYAATLQGKDRVRLVAPSAAADPQAFKKALPVKLASLHGLYREPTSGVLRVLNTDGSLGDIVLPSRLPQGAATAAAAVAAAVLEYQVQPKGGGQTGQPVSQMVALLAGNAVESVVGFLKREALAEVPHPYHDDLIAGAIGFANGSEALRAWRDQLKATMQASLDRFRNGGVDPTRLEAVLDQGLAAGRAYRLASGEGQGDDALQKELQGEQRRFLERVAVATVFRDAGMHDAFLETLDQLGLARYSRPDLAAAAEPALRASAQAHFDRAVELKGKKQWGKAFDEARVASSRAPCDGKISDLYYQVRVEYVYGQAVQALAEYTGDNKVQLEQIVRGLEALGPGDPSPEIRQEARQRIRAGEEMDRGYLPLQLQKAQFLVKVHELRAARDVVTGVERREVLGQAEKDEWLKLDSQIGSRLREIVEQDYKTAEQQLAAAEFGAALKTAQHGLQADPLNLRLLSLAAIAAAIQRDRETALHSAHTYFKTLALNCPDERDTSKSLLELYQAPDTTEDAGLAEGRMPNWMSGAAYVPGEVYYDPLSGSFQPHVTGARMDDKAKSVTTQFVWDGAMVQTIYTTEGPGQNQPRLEMPKTTVIVPVYDRKHFSMKEVGFESGAAGSKKAALTYRNSPEFDPVLAAKFVGKAPTRGWAGNPFFHPFIWDGIYLFDFEYDELGRIRKATPASDSPSRPLPQFAEPLTFTWEGSTKRLMSINGVRYSRQLYYDQQGRLIKEAFKHAPGNGWIEYSYDGQSKVPWKAVCSDNFYDNASRTVEFDKPRR